MYQRLIIVGRLGQDPEMRYTQEGKPVTNLSVATDKSWTDASGTKHEQTTWFRVAVWGNQAEPCAQYLAKGRTVLVEGEIQEPRVYQKKNGDWASSLEMKALNVRFLGGRGDASDDAGAQSNNKKDDGILYEEEIEF